MIADLCVKIIGVDRDTLTEDTEFEADLKARSQNVTMMLNVLEDEYDVEIPYMKFRRCKSLGESAEFVASLLEE